MSWWVSLDFGGEHEICESEEPLGFMWDGPFATFTEARRFILKAGADQVREIQNKNRWWREMSKAEILGPLNSGEEGT